MLKAIAKISAVAMVMGLASGCASQAGQDDHLRLEELGKQVADLNIKMSEVQGTASQALAQAQNAGAAASAAKGLAEKCNQICQAHGTHMEKMFRKSMMK